MMSRISPGAIGAQRRIQTLGLVVHELELVFSPRVLAVAHLASEELHTGASEDEEDQCRIKALDAVTLAPTWLL